MPALRLDCPTTVTDASPQRLNLQQLGTLLSHARQERGLDRIVAAKQLAMSVRQIQEIEEGGATAFYTETHKGWAARKYATFLGVDWPPGL